jgi:hypothetical protein
LRDIKKYFKLFLGHIFELDAEKPQISRIEVGALVVFTPRGSPIYAGPCIKYNVFTPSLPHSLGTQRFYPLPGIIFSSEIELPHAEMKALHDLEFTSLDGSSLFNQNQVESILIDIEPVLELIAQEWNYDLDLLKEGKGETGIDDHSWTMYSNNKISPVIVRWNMGKARIHLVMGNDHMQFKCIAIGNIEAKDVLERLTVILGSLYDESECADEIEVAIGDTIQKIKLGSFTEMSDFKTECILVMPNDSKLNDVRRKDCVQLANSCNLVILKESDVIGTQIGLRANEMLINIRDISRSFNYPADINCSWEIYKIIHGLSILDAGREMNRIIFRALDPEKAKRFNTQKYRLKHDRIAENDDPEITERRKFLSESCINIIKFIESHNNSNQANPKSWRKITIGGDFRNPKPGILKGTSPAKIILHGDVMTGPDLIELLVDTVMNLRSNLPGPKEGKPKEKKLKIKGRIEGVNQKEDTSKEFDYKIETISKPYFSLHMGMPVRVEQSLSIWRKDDSQALACDLWFDLDSGHLHLENLYRIKTPTT